MMQQARNVALLFEQERVPPTHLLRDHDGKFVPEFDAILASEGIAVKPVGVRAPNQNAVAERFVQSVRQECLDHFVVLGESHLRYLLGQYLGHYHQERPHQGLDNVPPDGSSRAEEAGPLSAAAEVRCQERLGGLLKHYYRAA
jgi:putative transposase